MDDYRPNVTAYLPKTLVHRLHERGRSPQGPQPAGTYARALLSRLMIDLSWASSRLEGNTYSLLDTQRLIEEGKSAPGFAWAYERSCLQYKTVRDSLPEPDPFRLQYRTALIETVGEIVRRRLAPTREHVAALAGHVPQADFEKFCTLVLAELEDLHEGNIARFRLRPAELREWQAR